MATISRENNFDLIRLFAAFQVVCWHSLEHLNLSERLPALLREFISFFPGVPIFFTVSGFLIYASYDRNPFFVNYLKNRCLRIFPGLWFAFIVTFVILIVTGFISPVILFSKSVVLWVLSQITIFQFYTPEILRGFGVGAPNGSLWTLFIEFSFYLFLPVFFLVVRRTRIKKFYLVLVLGFISLLYNIWYHKMINTSIVPESIVLKLLGLNLLPYLFYFLIGALIYEKWDQIKGFYQNKGWYWLIAYIVYCLVFSSWLGKFVPSYWPNIWGLMSIILIAQATISIAFTNITVSNKLLQHNDISYGLYLFHMPIINLMLHLNLAAGRWALIIVFTITIITALISWFLVEKPALSLKGKKVARSGNNANVN
jgi:peptidoglycan/LPS O-acetylase OafA/YrhL